MGSTSTSIVNPTTRTSFPLISFRSDALAGIYRRRYPTSMRTWRENEKGKTIFGKKIVNFDITLSSSVKS